MMEGGGRKLLGWREFLKKIENGIFDISNGNFPPTPSASAATKKSFHLASAEI
jgi:hypothetical protein